MRKDDSRVPLVNNSDYYSRFVLSYCMTDKNVIYRIIYKKIYILDRIQENQLYV